MPLTLSSSSPNQSALTRPNDPHDPNGIAHAVDLADTGNGVATKASRTHANQAWSRYVQDYKIALLVGDSAGPAEFDQASSGITYSDD